MGRTKNQWGQGARLRAEIVAAAGALVEETGSEDAISLRAVARKAGVAAPSIYAHFADLAAVVNAVVAQAFTELDAVLADAVDGVTDPERRLRLLCEAYVAFADEAPHRYRVAFGRHRAAGPGSLPAGTPLADLSGATAFGRLVDAVSAVGPAPPTGTADALLAATVLWAGLHGYASLAASVPAFPWPDRDAVLTALLRPVVHR